MKSKLIEWIKRRGIFACLSFLIPAGIMALVYYQIKIFPVDGYRSLLTSDAYSQYAMFFAGFNNMIKNNESILFNWSASLGLNNIAFMAYYLNSIFTPIVLLFDNVDMDIFMYFLTLIKFGCLGLSFFVYADQTFRLASWKKMILAISYALMGFSVAYSEVTLWFDGLMYLPLIILGVNRLLKERKPLLLFISYFLLFVSNFYIAFMIGLFSFLYFWASFFLQKKRKWKDVGFYLVTAFAAGGSSMFIIIPTILDISSNGESLSEINRFFTRTASPLTIFIKNMVGVYDSTKWDTLPFIYAGTLSILFCLFFFISKKFDRRIKIAYGSILAFIFVSFYIEALDLLWHGLHTPNMLLFRYSFTFSFVVIMVAGYGWEKYTTEDFFIMTRMVLGIFCAFIVVKLYTNLNDASYPYFYTKSFLWSAVSLISLLGIFWLQKKAKVIKLLPVLTLLIIGIELWANATGLIEGILYEWTYPTFEGVKSNAKDLQKLVGYTKKENPNHFYRMENLTAVTRNDSFFYGYSGVEMFSSIRNRHSSQYLDQLGFRSKETNLNILYDNNTLLMDSLLGIQYNLTKESDLLKFGFQPVKSSGEYTLYENEYVLPLGILTDDWIYQPEAVGNQTKLINHLAGQKEEEEIFTFTEAKIVKSKNLKLDNIEYGDVDVVSYSRKKQDKPIEITYEVEVPENQQAYLSMSAVDRSIGNPTMEVTVNEISYSSQPVLAGQYVSLGYYKDAQTVEVGVTFTYSNKDDDNRSVLLVEPDVALLNTNKFSKTVKKIQQVGVDIQVKGNKANAKLNVAENRVLLTTIPYDKGWKAYIDGKEVQIPTFKDAFLAIPIPEGEHEVELVYFPYGMKLGFGVSASSILIFSCLLVYLRKKKRMASALKEQKASNFQPDEFDKKNNIEKMDVEKKSNSKSLEQKSIVTRFEFEKETGSDFSFDVKLSQTEDESTSSETTKNQNGSSKK